VSGIVASAAGPVTLTLPLATTRQTASGLSLGTTGHCTALDATIPVPPSGPASLLAWAGVDFNVGPLVLGIALLLVAGVFEFGRGLQKDTEGLV
jgi:hypothetical protein